ncbi:hypothetical protein EDD85DRAFT_936571 [Armillaria nabsnona]|nr:hypothetical protein EDD85DRAFT_936571 [Armillaria nabsnona]
MSCKQGGTATRSRRLVIWQSVSRRGAIPSLRRILTILPVASLLVATSFIRTLLINVYFEAAKNRTKWVDTKPSGFPLVVKLMDLGVFSIPVVSLVAASS